MQLEGNEIIGKMVSEDYRYATVFKRYKIDFCCQGKRTVQEACAKNGTSLSELNQALNEAITQESVDQTDPRQWPLDLLCDYIEKTHHRYVERRSQEMLPFLDKLAKVHGSRHPELVSIKELFTEAVGALAQHMKKEELILFPYIRKMVQNGAVGTPSFGTVNNPIAMMEHEHDAEGERFRQIAELSQQYTPPADACQTYRISYQLLEEFESDLHRHIHLENNILFPAASAMENRLTSA